MTKNRKDIPFVSILLVGINVVVFFVTLRSEYMLSGKGFLGVYEVFKEGEYGRLITSMFLHADLEHLFNNMLILLFLGAMLEKEIGHLLLLVVYMLSGLAGSVFSMGMQMVTNDYYYSLGASGAVFGLIGMLFYLVIRRDERIRVSMPAMLFMVAYCIYSSFVGEQINVAAHLGGLISGMLLMFVLYR